MSTYQITSGAGVDLGTYEATSREEALDAMARDADYADFATACRDSGDDGAHLVVSLVVSERDRAACWEEAIEERVNIACALVVMALGRDSFDREAPPWHADLPVPAGREVVEPRDVRPHAYRWAMATLTELRESWPLALDVAASTVLRYPGAIDILAGYYCERYWVQRARDAAAGRGRG